MTRKWSRRKSTKSIYHALFCFTMKETVSPTVRSVCQMKYKKNFRLTLTRSYNVNIKKNVKNNKQEQVT
jgi:hypothetical protein